MKFYSIILILFLKLAPTSCQGQEAKDQVLTNAEKFSLKAGSLIQKEFIEIGKIKSAKLTVIHYTDLINNQKVSSLKFESEVASKYSTSTKAAVLDVDEIDGLIKSIKHLQTNIFPTAANNYTEIYFRCRGGFESGCFWTHEGWSPYLKLEKYDSDSYVFLEKVDFPILLALLEDAKSKM